MSRMIATCVLSVLMAAIPVISSTERAIEGQWIGGYLLAGKWTLLSMHVSSGSSGPVVSLDAPSMGIAAQPATDVRIESSSLQYRITLSTAQLEFNGRIGDNQIDGAVVYGNERGRFQLIRSVAIDPSSLAQYQGAYEWDDNSFGYIQFWDELGKNQLGMFDESGQVRSLYPMGRDEFFVGPGLRFPVPLEATIRFNRGGQDTVRSLLWQSINGVQRTAKVVHLAKEEAVSFNNASIRLSGTLIMPLTKGPHPALVVVHGSGPQDRSASLPFVQFLIRYGIALLVYDKRGVGGSTGDWRRSSFEDLADDAIAGVHFLQTNPEIDSRQIGIFGVSQGGWIGPLAASRSSGVAFVVSVSGPGVTPGEETLDFLQNEMRVDGLSRDDALDAVELTKLFFDYSRTGDGWEAYLAARQTSIRKPWFPFMELPDKQNTWQQEFWHINVAYDPTKTLQEMRCPVLALFGGRDLNVVADKNIAIWNAALKQGGNSDYTLVVLGSGNHLLLESRTGSIFELPHLQTFVLGYSHVLVQWLCARLKGMSCTE